MVIVEIESTTRRRLLTAGVWDLHFCDQRLDVNCGQHGGTQLTIAVRHLKITAVLGTHGGHDGLAASNFRIFQVGVGQASAIHPEIVACPRGHAEQIVGVAGRLITVNDRAHYRHFRGENSVFIAVFETLIFTGPNFKRRFLVTLKNDDV